MATTPAASVEVGGEIGLPVHADGVASAEEEAGAEAALVGEEDFAAVAASGGNFVAI